MIFPGYLELRDINDYRDKAMRRKLCYYEKNYPDRQFGVHQLEFDVLECIERVREFEELPFIDVVEIGDISKARKNSKLKEIPRVSCDIGEHDGYLINYDCETPVKLGRYIDLIFGRPWKEYQIALRAKDGIEYKPYEKSLYEFPLFRKFDVCRVNLSDYIRKIEIWFIGLHELAHIKNGHVKLMADVRAGRKTIDIDTFRALEIHADITAADMLLKIMSSWQKYVGIRQPVPQPNGKNPGVTYCDELMFAALAAYLALRSFLKREMWDEYTIGLHEMDREKHPLTELRMAIVYNVFLQGVIELGENALEKQIFANSLFRAIQQFEEFWFQNHSMDEEEKLYYKPTELLRTEKGKEYYHRLFDKVMGLNDLLKDYTDTLSVVEGQWSDYETLPERMYWAE